MRALLTKKLLWFVLYSAAVTALPALATTPAAKLVLPLLKSETAAVEARPACVDGRCPLTPATSSSTPAAPISASSCCNNAARPWWQRGPLRRGVRAVACFISRPWRR